ncbi:MAG: Yip1 family protein [Gemmatimonadales bacterium]
MAAPPGRPSPMLDRVKGILFQPGATWERIAGEFTTSGAIYRSYVLRLAAVPAVALVLGYGLFGMTTMFGRIKVPWETAAKAGVAHYVLSLVGVWVLAMVINAMADTFGGTRNAVQAVKVAAYGWTPAWLAGVFVAVPGGSWLQLLGLYSLYVLYAGLTPVMKSPPDRVAGYAVVTAVAAMVLGLVMQAVGVAFLPQGGR